MAETHYILPNGGSRSIPKNSESKTVNHPGSGTTISCPFPSAAQGLCVIIGSLYEYVPAFTGMNGLKVTNCNKYAVHQFGSRYPSSPGQITFFIVFAEGISGNSTLTTDTLTTNAGSTVTINADFYWG